MIPDSVLVTGGSGTLGQAMAALLPEAQYPSSRILNVKDSEGVSAYFEKNQVKKVVHLAAMAGINLCQEKKDLAYDVNVEGVRRMLKAAQRSGCDHFIYLSTACVFPGTDSLEKRYDEGSLPDPKHYYGLTKYLAEEICHDFRSEGMKVTVVRTNFAGMPWQYPKAFTDRFGTYLFASGVAKGLMEILVESPELPLIHLCGERALSMFEYATLGGSKVEAMTMAEYQGTDLTINMCLASKVWHHYRIEDEQPS